jgi:hypothetical protein
MAKRSEYRTVNADLAAALWAYGMEPLLETVDGITVEFVFPDDGHAPSFPKLTADWQAGELNVDAKLHSQRTRQLRTKMRKTCEEFIRERRSALRKKV